MAETHIAHAIATFSELGIATGLVWLGDVVKLKSNLESDLVVAEEGLRITTDDYHTKADGFDGTIRSGIRLWIALRKFIYTKIIFIFLVLLRWSPYACIALGIYSLFGISFYLSAPGFMPAALTYSRDTLDKIYFGAAFLSFMATCIPLIPIVTKKIINRYVLKDIPIA